MVIELSGPSRAFINDLVNNQISVKGSHPDRYKVLEQIDRWNSALSQDKIHVASRDILFIKDLCKQISFSPLEEDYFPKGQIVRDVYESLTEGERKNAEIGEDILGKSKSVEPSGKVSPRKKKTN